MCFKVLINLISSPKRIQSFLWLPAARNAKLTFTNVPEMYSIKTKPDGFNT